MSSSSTVFYRHENNKSIVKAGKKHVENESIIDGTKGLSFKYVQVLHSDDKVYKIHAKQLESGDYEVSETKGKASEKNAEDKKTMSESDLIKLIGKNKKLDFITSYLTKERKKVLKEKGGARKGSKKTSKKKSKKSSKKKSKRASKKTTKKKSKKTSKKKSKKTSKKSSKKTSKKNSKKRGRSRKY